MGLGIVFIYYFGEYSFDLPSLPASTAIQAGGVVTTAACPGGIDIDGDGFVDGEQDPGTDPAFSNLEMSRRETLRLTCPTCLTCWC
jgi:hypothetical protein